MKIKSIKHKAVKRLFLEDNPKGLPSDCIEKLRAMLTFLQDMRNPETLRVFPLWKTHQLTGGRKGVWSLHVTRNWRLTFQVEGDEIASIDFEDYH